MKPLILALWLGIFGGVLAPSAFSTPPPAVKSPYEVGDQAFRERRSSSKGHEALEFYREAYKKNPTDSEAAWRVSMGCYFVGIRLTESKSAKKTIHDEGWNAGLAGVKLNPNCGPCHFWAAINRALFAEAVGVLKVLFSLGDVEDHLRKSIASDPTYAFGGAYRLLGLIEQKLPGIFGGDNDEAKQFFLKAIEFGPGEPLNYLFLARLLKDEFDDLPGALDFAKRGLSVPTPTPDRMEAEDALVDLKNFIQENDPAQKKK